MKSMKSNVSSASWSAHDLQSRWPTVTIFKLNTRFFFLLQLGWGMFSWSAPRSDRCCPSKRLLTLPKISGRKLGEAIYYLKQQATVHMLLQLWSASQSELRRRAPSHLTLLNNHKLASPRLAPCKPFFSRTMTSAPKQYTINTFKPVY